MKTLEDILTGKVGTCTCGHTQDPEGNCDGSHLQQC